MWSFILFCSLVAIVAIYLSRYLEHQTVLPSSAVEQHDDIQPATKDIFDEQHDIYVTNRVEQDNSMSNVAIDVNIERDIIEVKEDCSFLADIGNVCPLIVQGKQYTIDNYKKQPFKIKQEVATLLQQEWGSNKLSYTQDYIESNWEATNVMYVFIANGEMVGCVAIDRHKFYPFVSHLYIKDTHRGHGYAKHLLKLCEEYGKRLKFSDIKLWCAEHLVRYYQKLGWTIESVGDNNICVMSKKVIA